MDGWVCVCACVLVCMCVCVAGCHECLGVCAIKDSLGKGYTSIANHFSVVLGVSVVTAG